MKTIEPAWERGLQIRPGGKEEGDELSACRSCVASGLVPGAMPPTRSDATLDCYAVESSLDGNVVTLRIPFEKRKARRRAE